MLSRCSIRWASNLRSNGTSSWVWATKLSASTCSKKINTKLFLGRESPFAVLLPFTTVNNSRTLGGQHQYPNFRQDYDGAGDSSKMGWTGVGISGFSLGFLGFFEKEKLSPEDELLMKIKRGILAIQREEYDKAERHLGDAWNMSKEMNREDVQTQIMDIQANLAVHKGELNRAVRLFQLVTQRMVYHQGVETTDNKVVEISIKLANIFAVKGKAAESRAGYQFCVDVQREKIKKGEKDEDTLMLAAWSMQSLAHAYMTSGTEGDKVDAVAISKAAELAKEAHDYATEAVGSDSQQAIAISSDLASILALQGNVDAALKQLEECEKMAAEKHQYLQAAIRVNTGSLYLQKGEYTEAQRICKEAKMIAGMYRDGESVIRADECIAKSKSAEKNRQKYINDSKNQKSKMS